jgi:hypothetical protein
MDLMEVMMEMMGFRPQIENKTKNTLFLSTRLLSQD